LRGGLGSPCSPGPPLNSFLPLPAPPHVPVDLAADALDHLGVAGPEAVSGKKAAHFEHPVFRVLLADVIDL
jgi:hypothetical protein